MLHGGGYGGNGVVVGTALQPGEHGRVDLGLVVVVHRLSALVRLLRRRKRMICKQFLIQHFTGTGIGSVFSTCVAEPSFSY